MKHAHSVARATAALAAAAACLALSACGLQAAAATPPPLIWAPAPACPPKPLATLPAETWAPARSELAPPGPDAIRLCRFAGLNAHPRLALVRSRLVRGRGLMGEIVSELDRLPSVPPGVYNCPSDDGSQIVLRLAYPAGEHVTVTVDLTGCNTVANGSVARTAVNTGLIARLEGLLARRKRPRHHTARPADAHWSVLARSPIGSPGGATMLWDGHDLLELFGGSGAAASYNPATGRWHPLGAAPAALQSANAASVWTGSQVFVLGGTAALYDPAANRWTQASAAPFGALNQATAVWTGSRVIVAGLTQPTSGQLDVAAYDPASNSWSALPPPISSDHPPVTLAMVATGDGVLLWSLWSRSQPAGPGSFSVDSGVDVFRLASSGGWTNVTGSWPQNYTVDQPTFTGTQILFAPRQIWCGDCPGPLLLDTHGYFADPGTLSVTAIPHGPLDDLSPQIVWTGSAEISLNAGGETSGPAGTVLPGDIAIWSPRTKKWTRGPRAPRPLSEAPAVWAGGRLYALARNGVLLAYGR